MAMKLNTIEKTLLSLISEDLDILQTRYNLLKQGKLTPYQIKQLSDSHNQTFWKAQGIAAALKTITKEDREEFVQNQLDTLLAKFDTLI